MPPPDDVGRHLTPAQVRKPADEPQFNIGANQSRSGLVYVCIGTGTDGYSITPERAEGLAAELLDAANAARAAAG